MGIRQKSARHFWGVGRILLLLDFEVLAEGLAEGDGESLVAGSSEGEVSRTVGVDVEAETDLEVAVDVDVSMGVKMRESDIVDETELE